MGALRLRRCTLPIPSNEWDAAGELIPQISLLRELKLQWQHHAIL